ncbi:MAG: VCBS repeat-containing protein [Phycisphaeraceae bacterium]|nr:VCBS repeat-containing protein [Phycisphaeraceae bacterium]
MATLLAAMLCVLAVPDKTSGQTEPVPQFKPAVRFDAFVTYPYGMAVADVMDAQGNPGQDGNPELAIVGTGWDLLACGSEVAGGLIRVFRNTGTWQSDPANAMVPHWAANIPGAFATEVAFADVTGVNGPDLVVLTLYGGGGVLYVFPNQGNGEFANEPLGWAAPGSPLRGLAVVDVDNDGDLDVIAAVNDCPAGGPRNKIVVFENRSTFEDLIFVPTTIALDIAGDVAPGDIAAGDFFALSAGQPLIDFVTPNPYADSVTAMRNLGGLQFDPVTIDAPQACGSQTWLYETIVSGRFGVDAHWDFAAVETGQPYVGVFLGNGFGAFQSFCDNPALRYRLYSGAANIRAHGIAAGHFNGGTKLDLVVTLDNVDGPTGSEEWSGAVAVLLGRADGTFQTPSANEAYIYTSMLIDRPTMVVAADFNNDGYDDIATSSFYTEAFSVMINKMITAVGP